MATKPVSVIRHKSLTQQQQEPLGKKKLGKLLVWLLFFFGLLSC